MKMVMELGYGMERKSFFLLLLLTPSYGPMSIRGGSMDLIYFSSRVCEVVCTGAAVVGGVSLSLYLPFPLSLSLSPAPLSLSPSPSLSLFLSFPLSLSLPTSSFLNFYILTFIEARKISLCTSHSFIQPIL
eukprot:TRINITY_DN272_c0_g1_i5.p1 TRINITY_DN272_c0_g1~~TRINITY_DN272_c0_g1_i5.p1  ORF type:complete len:131 (+),score=30.43 TRINITY_DN272_c0_g1_i5:443-835(+)